MVRRNQGGRHGECSLSGMKSVMTQVENDPARTEGSAPDIEKECEIWDWARAAGASAQDLRKALLEALGGAEAGYSGT